MKFTSLVIVSDLVLLGMFDNNGIIIMKIA